MAINVRAQDDVAVVTPNGKFLGSIRGSEFREVLTELRQAGVQNVVVDLSKTDFMDSTGIGVLIAGLTTMRSDGGEIRLAGLEARIKNLFVMSHLLGPVFESYDTVDDARRSYDSVAHA